STQSGRKAHGGGNDDHQKAETNGHHEDGLVVQETADPVHKGWKEIDPKNEPQDHEEAQFCDSLRELPAGQGVSGGHRREDNEQQNGRKILDDQNSKDQVDELSAFEP